MESACALKGFPTWTFYVDMCREYSGRVQHVLGVMMASLANWLSWELHRGSLRHTSGWVAHASVTLESIPSPWPLPQPPWCSLEPASPEVKHLKPWGGETISFFKLYTPGIWSQWWKTGQCTLVQAPPYFLIKYAFKMLTEAPFITDLWMIMFH